MTTKTAHRNDDSTKYYTGTPRSTDLMLAVQEFIMSIDSPTSKSELREALDELVVNAYQNGVTVDNGGYELCHPDQSVPDWDVTIIRLAKPDTT